MSIAKDALTYYDAGGRTLPFRGTHDPYRVWVSEIMLQQTRTGTVGAYYERFLSRFPSVRALADAFEGDVLKMWEGLGYYSRARNLHKTAKIVAYELGGAFPEDYEALQTLPGIGQYTAAAIASIAFGIAVPAMDGNLTRVIARLFAVRQDVTIPSVRRALFEKGKEILSQDRPGDMNQALMDIAAAICVPGTPDCGRCPLCVHCAAYREGDADSLPVKPVKTPPRPVSMAVVLMTYHNQILCCKRREKLLCGMYVYLLIEGADTREQVEEEMAALGLDARFKARLCDARHVFTHRIWNMSVWHFAAQNSAVPPGGCYVSRAEHDALPIPTAMRAAKSHAEALLK